ncbi:MAG: SixA phosphatase family protein [Planctomycetota bacterium]
MDLFIVRHAWAGQHGDPAWPDDRLRPLTKEGISRFASVVRKLSNRGFAPGAVATSPMVRCLQTAQIVAESVPAHPNIVELDDLLPGGSLSKLLAWTIEQEDRCQSVAWVGHAPDVCRLAGTLIAAENGWLRFSKGAIAALKFDGSPKAGQAELRWLVTARVLGC